MERLTERTSSGAANLAYPAACYFNDGTRDGIATSAYRQKAINRLAAYEDTGLLPEDFKKAFNEDALLKTTAQYLGTTPDRLREWAKADKEDRLVALPCKVGDTVWFVDRRWDRTLGRGVSFVNDGYVKAIKFSSRPTKITVEYPDHNDREGRCRGADYFARNIGKTAFLTREEAEAALEGGKDHG